jgi:opacity protein-like surface antigen
MKMLTIKPLVQLAAITSLSLSVAIPSLAFADDDGTGLTFTGSYGGYKSRGGEFDDDNDLYELSLGYRFLPFLGVEVSYTDLGTFGGDLASAEVDGYSASLQGIIPLTDSFQIYGEVGQFFSNTEVDVLDFKDTIEDDTTFFGVGASFKIAEPLWFNVEYQRYKIDVNDENWPVEISEEDTDIDAVKVGALLQF